ncbi:two-component system response regulator [Streptomyces bingchenggensis BCW-1]|uniref:Two-component system response regulator n=1 Tax=Streptomyces bingchenggensis (strain BCW-1) TaxID=749414 RepID=D7C911_STRBB|nr:two-component system response regulator [Streptomyces bingchenggensis BCW-1]
MVVVGEAGTVAEALAGIPAAHPEVALLDLRLPDGSGVEVCREIRAHHPDIKCVMLTSFADDAALIDAIMAGAYGYVLKDVGSGELLRAVRDVAAGRSLLDPAATARLLERMRTDAETGTDTAAGAGELGDDRSADLTVQERRILLLIGEGLTNRAIGERLHLAEKTIKNYVSGLLAKLGMERRSQAAAYVARLQAQAQAHAPPPSQAQPQARDQERARAAAEERKTQPQKH